ncbi:MAG TPA: monovalent cation/H+ antiporter subunit A, partial [Rhodanobacteraceae bacterium]|nr:monovalent cation/H+ antiporter subunit A [Rhodanobacteraceae bacterium]
MPYAWIAIALACLPYLASIGTLLIGHRRRKRTTWIMTTTAAVCLVLAVLFYPAIDDGGVVRESIAWIPGLGLDFILRVDGLTWLFLMLVCGIGLLVGIYAAYYMPGDHTLVRFFALLLAFMGSMLNVVLSGNMIQMVFFWELTGLFSFLLIGYWYRGESARDAARTALIVTGSGGLCLLAGALLIGHVAGSYDLDVILAAGDRIRHSALYLPALVLILIGALTKSAQFPFHFWLPSAMSAPTPVSAYLHSATLVKLGIFVLLRFWPVLAGTDAWFWLLGGAGLISLVLGAWSAMYQNDLKGILAYSTISHLGLIAMLLGLGSTLGAVAAIFHTVNHATFKASLFMAAGAVDNETGTRDLRKLGGLRHVMPITATLAIIASAAMAGVPLLNGFLSKEMFFAVALGSHHGPTLDTVIAVLAVAGAGLSVTYSLRLVASTFFGPVREDWPRVPNEPPRWMLFPIGFLALACLAVGIFPARVIGPTLHNAALSVLGTQIPDYSLMIWHGLTKPLMMSVVALIGGCLLYVIAHNYLMRRDGPPLLRHISFKRIFERALVALTDTLPAWHRRLFPERRLQVQLSLLVLAALVVATVSVGSLTGDLTLRGVGIDPGFALLWLLGGICAVAAAILAKFHRMAALILAGGVGLVVCVTFVWLSAPDLAITQLLVESVTTILILLGLRWLPKRIKGLSPETRRARYRRRRDVLIAACAGTGLAALAFAAMRHPVADTVSRYFLEHALPDGGGRNVVNVILVDFRSLDTLGEITVLAIVALTVFALLRRFRPATESIGATNEMRQAMQNAPADEPSTDADNRTPADYLAVPAILMMLAVPFVLLFGTFLFLRGHDLPGGGFAAGITVTLALVVLYMARGARWVEARLRVAPMRWIGTGLLLAILAGVGAIVAGHPFLTSYHGQLDLPVLGTVHVV